ncbi:MAG TPA: NIL domain-containing protein [Acidimicrobiales bacterium]
MSSAKIKLTFPEQLITQPIVARLARERDVLPNIRRASVEGNVGWIVCELSGEAAAIDGAISWLREGGVQVDLLGDVVES